MLKKKKDRQNTNNGVAITVHYIVPNASIIRKETRQHLYTHSANSNVG